MASLKPLTFHLGKQTYTLSPETLQGMRSAMEHTVTRELGFTLLGDSRNLMPGKERVGTEITLRLDDPGAKGSFHTHPYPDPDPTLSANDWAYAVTMFVRRRIPFLVCSGAQGEVYCTTIEDIDRVKIPRQLTDEAIDELVQHLAAPYHFRLY